MHTALWSMSRYGGVQSVIDASCTNRAVWVTLCSQCTLQYPWVPLNGPQARQLVCKDDNVLTMGLVPESPSIVPLLPWAWCKMQRAQSSA